MRCGCPQCGIYMVQREHGLSSGCVCPNCSFSCDACMGTEQPPLDVEALRDRIEHLRQEERLQER